MSLPTTGKISTKRYECAHCGAITNESTNHWGEIYSPCRTCSWERPLEATVKRCLEPVPDGYGIPEPWQIVKLGDIAEITEGLHL